MPRPRSDVDRANLIDKGAGKYVSTHLVVVAALRLSSITAKVNSGSGSKLSSPLSLPCLIKRKSKLNNQTVSVRCQCGRTLVKNEIHCWNLEHHCPPLPCILAGSCAKQRRLGIRCSYQGQHLDTPHSVQ